MVYYGNELYHHGVKGQKWGVRNYQNKDGSYTAKGAAENNGSGRYSNFVRSVNAKFKKANKAQEMRKKTIADHKNSDEYKAKKEKMAKAAKIGLAVAGTALAAYGAYKLSEHIKDKAFGTAMYDGNRYATKILDFNTPTSIFYDGRSKDYSLKNKFGDVIERGKTDDVGWLSTRRDEIGSISRQDFRDTMKGERENAKYHSSSLGNAVKYLSTHRDEAKAYNNFKKTADTAASYDKIAKTLRRVGDYKKADRLENIAYNLRAKNLDGTTMYLSKGRKDK